MTQLGKDLSLDFCLQCTTYVKQGDGFMSPTKHHFIHKNQLFLFKISEKHCFVSDILVLNPSGFYSMLKPQFKDLA